MHAHGFVTIVIRAFTCISIWHIYRICYIGCERTVLQSRCVFNVKVVAVVVPFSMHSLLLECTDSHILKQLFDIAA